jgi:hypothetical protein
MVGSERREQCGVALLTIPGMQMFVIQCNHKRHVVMRYHAQQSEAVLNG